MGIEAGGHGQHLNKQPRMQIQRALRGGINSIDTNARSTGTRVGFNYVKNGARASLDTSSTDPRTGTDAFALSTGVLKTDVTRNNGDPSSVVNTRNGITSAERKKELDEWRNATVRIRDSITGEIRPPRATGGQLRLDEEANPNNRILEMYYRGNWEQVMGDDERPWCRATVDAMFKGIDQDVDISSEKPLQVLVRGAGLLISERMIKDKLIGLGHGRLTIIELNKNRAQVARKWADRQNAYCEREGIDVRINIIEGDAAEETAKLETGTIDLFFSDTYPLNPQEEGLNDIGDLPEIRRVTTDKARLTFFMGTKHPNPAIAREQIHKLTDHGWKYELKDPADIQHSNYYDYLKEIDEVPVVVITKTTKSLAAAA